MVSEIFARRLYKDHFICIDDLAVATGRKTSLAPGPSQVADVINAVQEQDASTQPRGVVPASGTGRLVALDPS